MNKLMNYPCRFTPEVLVLPFWAGRDMVNCAEWIDIKKDKHDGAFRDTHAYRVCEGDTKG